MANLCSSVAGFLLLAAAQTGNASQWVPVRSEMGRTILIDTESRMVINRIRHQAWFKEIQPAPVKLPGGKAYDETKFLISAYCDDRKLAVVAIHFYLGTTIQFSDETPRAMMRAVIPDTEGELWFRAVCERR